MSLFPVLREKHHRFENVATRYHEGSNNKYLGLANRHNACDVRFGEAADGLGLAVVSVVVGVRHEFAYLVPVCFYWH